jgi:hypothetical protein
MPPAADSDRNVAAAVSQSFHRVDHPAIRNADEVAAEPFQEAPCQSALEWDPLSARVLEIDPAFTISAWIARGGQSNAKLMTEGLRKAGLPE